MAGEVLKPLWGPKNFCTFLVRRNRSVRKKSFIRKSNICVLNIILFSEEMRMEMVLLGKFIVLYR